MKNEKMKKFIKKHWIIISVMLVAMSSIAIVVWARYEDANNSMKRTIVSTAESLEKRFTSNVLIRTEELSLPSPRTNPVSENSKVNVGGVNYYPVQVIVRNYTASDTTHFYESPIDYTLTATLTDVNGTSITNAAKAGLIKYIDGSNNVQSFALTGGVYKMPDDTFTLNSTTHDKTYTFYFNESLLNSNDKVFVNIAAVPTDSVIRSDVKTLKGIISISSQATEIVQTWSGYFSDEGAASANNTHNPEASAYDGFNYTIQGNGARTVSLTWNTAYLELNVFSKDKIKAVSQEVDSVFTVTETTTNGLTTMTFKVDSDKCPRYDLQFYMVGTELASWDTVDTYVTFNPDATP